MSTSSADSSHPEWAKLLEQAVSVPGVISDAYRRFWNYSVGNQILAMFQCLARGLQPGPINTFLGWQDLGRHVKKGEKAIELCMPISVNRKRRDADAAGDHADHADEHHDGAGPDDLGAGGGSFTRFVYRPHWFVLCQTEGAEYTPAELPQWSEAAALAALKIERLPFEHPNGNCQGYAYRRSVAVSPIAFMPHRTLLHELAHVVLGHTEELERLDDGDFTPVNLREVEAESVALLCCASLNLGGELYSKGYIQNWLGKGTIPEKSAQKIFKAADMILKAGYPHAEQVG